MKNATLSALAAVACAVSLSSCAILGLRQEVERMVATGGVTAIVSGVDADAGPTYVLAIHRDSKGGRRTAAVQTLCGDGVAGFALALGKEYTVAAFTDEDGNHAYDVGEPLAYRRDVVPARLADADASALPIPLVLRREHVPPDGITHVKIPEEDRSLGSPVPIVLGEVVSLDEDRFLPEGGTTGLWRPLEFLGGNNLGIYFLEPYDPARVPVIFVNGIGGSPQDWRHIIENLDRSRYQAWFFHYPSGMRLDKVSRALAYGMVGLRSRHDPERMVVVAHSMGGLVAHRAITHADSLVMQGFEPDFVSISTPWGGHQAAESGIRHLKTPVPSWFDVAPGSEYLVEIYSTPLPEGARHSILYGEATVRRPWLKEANDGTVTVASQTDARVAERAASVCMIPLGHVEILSSDDVLERLETLIE